MIGPSTTINKTKQNSCYRIMFKGCVILTRSTEATITLLTAVLYDNIARRICKGKQLYTLFVLTVYWFKRAAFYLN